MAKPTILAFAGPTRLGSYNKLFVKVGAAAARAAGADVDYLDLRDLPMPLYDGDLEEQQGLPENAKAFKRQLLSHQAFLISAGEYNSSIPGVLKNAIDWASRSEPGEPALACFRGKVAALMSASPGALGGLRSLVHVRSILGNIGVLIVPDQVALPRAHEAFAPDGTLKDAKTQQSVERLCGELIRLLTKLS